MSCLRRATVGVVVTGLLSGVSAMALSVAFADAASAANPPWYRQWSGQTCDHSSTATPNVTQSCVQLDLNQINAARAQEGVRPMGLPSNYTSLTPGEQLFVATNAERVDRGIRAVVALTDQLDGLAAQGAGRGTDPPFPANHQWGGAVWAGGYASTLEAVYAWMYDDGVGSTNGACTQAGDPGCWGHRNNILGNPGATMTGGAATGYGQWGTEYAVEFIQSNSSTGNYVYTWSQAYGGPATPPPASPGPKATPPAAPAVASPAAPAVSHPAAAPARPTASALLPSAHRSAVTVSAAPHSAAPSVAGRSATPPVPASAGAAGATLVAAQANTRTADLAPSPASTPQSPTRLRGYVLAIEVLAAGASVILLGRRRFRRSAFEQAAG